MLNTLQGKLGTVNFTSKTGIVKTESEKYSGTVTTYAVENEFVAADHFEPAATKGTLSGTLIDGIESAYLLKQMEKAGDVLTYTGSSRIENIVLDNLELKTDSSIYNGFNFTASYTQIDIVSAQYVEMGENLLMSQQDAGKSEAVKANSKPTLSGQISKIKQTVSSNAYMAYVNTYNDKLKPNQSPAMRSTPANTGY